MLKSSALTQCLKGYTFIIHVGAPQMKRKPHCLRFIRHPFQEQKQMFQPEKKTSKLQASVKVSFTLLMSGNDGRCVLKKAFCVHTAQTVLSNGIFSEENPASPQCIYCELNCE